MTKRRINSVNLRRHKLCAMTVVFPHEITKHVDARLLIPFRINLIIKASLAIVLRCGIVNERLQRLRAPEQVKDTFYIQKKSANNHPEVGF